MECQPIQKLEPFLKIQQQKKIPVAIITSGGTTAPLEQQTVRFLDNFSAGTRGAVSTEILLEKGYACIFMHRKYSMEPYSRRFSHCFLDMLEYKNGQVIFDEKHKGIVENAVILHQKEKNKIQSGGPLELKLEPVPKMIGPLVEKWCPRAFVVSFKLETDPNLIESKAKAALEKYKHNCVIGNILETRKEIVWIFDGNGQQEIKRTTNEIEETLVQNIIERHYEFMNKQETG